MAKKLRTGETTNLGFIRALKERGADVKFSSPAETMRDELDSISSKKVTFQSTNETVVEAVNTSEPGPGPGPSDRINLTLSFLDSETGEPVSNFNLIVNNDETGVNLFNGTVAEDRFTISVEKNIRVYYDFSKDGYDSLGGTIGLGETDAEQSVTVIKAIPHTAVTLVFRDSETDQELPEVSFSYCRLYDNSGMEIFNLDNTQTPVTPNLVSNATYSLVWDGNDDYANGSISFYVGNEPVEMRIGLYRIPEEATITINEFIDTPSGKAVSANVKLTNIDTGDVIANGSYDYFSVVVPTRYNYRLDITGEYFIDQHFEFYLIGDNNLGTINLDPNYADFHIQIVDASGESMIVPKVEVIDQETGNVVDTFDNTNNFSVNLQNKKFYDFRFYFRDSADIVVGEFLDNETTKTITLSPQPAPKHRVHFRPVEESTGNIIDSGNISGTVLVDNVMGVGYGLTFDNEAGLYYGDLMDGRRYSVRLTFDDRATGELTDIVNYEDRVIEVGCGDVVSEGTVTFDFYSRSEKQYVTMEDFRIENAETGEVVYEGSMGSGGTSNLPVAVMYRVIASYADETRQTSFYMVAAGASVYLEFEGPTPPTKGVTLEVVDAETGEGIVFNVSSNFYNSNGDLIVGGYDEGIDTSIDLFQQAFDVASITMIISADGYTEVTRSSQVSEEPYELCHVELQPEVSPKGTSFIFYDNETQDRIHPLATIHYEILDGAGTQLENGEFTHDLSEGELVLETTVEGAVNANVYFTFSNGDYIETEPSLFGLTENPYVRNNLGLDPTGAPAQHTITANVVNTLSGVPIEDKEITFTLEGTDPEGTVQELTNTTQTGSQWNLVYDEGDYDDYTDLRVSVRVDGYDAVEYSETFSANEDISVDIQYTLLQTLSLSVFDSVTSEPIEEFNYIGTINYVDATSEDVGGTSDGNTVDFARFNADSLSITISKEGYGDLTTDLMFNPGEEPYYEEVSLLPNITIRASVVDGLGAPYEGGDLVYKLMGGNSGIIEEDTELVSMSSSSSEETFTYTLGDYSDYGYLRVVVTNEDETIKSYTDNLAPDNNEDVELVFGERNFTLNIENSVPEGINDGLNIDVSYSDMFGNELENFSLENQGSPLVLTTGLPVADISLHITHENYEDYDTNAVPAVAPETAEDTVYLDAKRFEFNIDLSYDDQPISLGSNVIVDLQGLEIGTNDWVSLDSTDVGPDTSSCILGYTPVDYPDIDPERLRVYAICEEENVYGLSDEFSKYNESVSVSLTPVDRILHLETFESGTTVQIPDGYSDLIDILVDDPNFTPEVLLINDSSDGATQIDTSSVTLSCINVPDETESHLGIVFNESDTFNYATFSSAYYGNSGELVLSSSSDVTNNYLLFNVTDGSDIELPGTSYNSKVSDFVRLWYDELSFGTPVDCNLILFNTVEGYSSAYLGSLEKVDDDYSFFTYEGGIDYKLCVLRRNDGYDDADFRLVCLGDPGTCLVRQEISLDTPDNQVLETLGDDAFTGVIIPAIESREGSSFTIIVEDGTPRVFSECTMVGENQFTCVGETGTFKVSIIVDPDTGDTSVLVENVSFEGGEA